MKTKYRNGGQAGPRWSAITVHPTVNEGPGVVQILYDGGSDRDPIQGDIQLNRDQVEDLVTRLVEILDDLPGRVADPEFPLIERF